MHGYYIALFGGIREGGCLAMQADESWAESYSSFIEEWMGGYRFQRG